MLNYETILANSEKQIQKSLQDLVNIIKEKIKKKNSTIIQLQEELRKKNKEVSEQQKNNENYKKRYEQLIQKEAEHEINTKQNDAIIKSILKRNKKIFKILNKKKNIQKQKMKCNFYRKIINLSLSYKNKYFLDKTKNKDDKSVNKEDLEAFRIIMIDLESKKNKIEELNKNLKEKNETNENLINELNKNKVVLDRTILEKNNLQNLNNNYKAMIEAQDNQLKTYVDINNENVKNKFKIQKLEVQLNEKKNFSNTQQNIIMQLENTIKKKDIKINELKNKFFELVNDFNNILNRIK